MRGSSSPSTRTTPNQASSCSISTSTVSSSAAASRARSARSDRVSTSSSSVSLASHPSSVRASSAAKYTVTLPLFLGVPVGGPPGGGYGRGLLCAEPHPLGIVTETERSGDVFDPLCPALLTECRPSRSVALRLPPPADRTRLLPRPRTATPSTRVLPAERTHTHGVAEAGGLGAAGLDTVAQL